MELRVNPGVSAGYSVAQVTRTTFYRPPSGLGLFRKSFLRLQTRCQIGSAAKQRAVKQPTGSTQVIQPGLGVTQLQARARFGRPQGFALFPEAVAEAKHLASRRTPVNPA